MGLSCFRAISGLDGLGMDGMGWDLCAGLFYEHRFAMLIILNEVMFRESLTICTALSTSKKMDNERFLNGRLSY